jgi:cellulose synthase/poly-beta-1,6-N-acetylglucosamine synthase-like glycosyltransferase
VLIHPRLVATTDAPARIGALLRQRRRWAGGFAETLLQHRAMVGDARLGMLGLAHLVHSSLTLPQPLGLLVLILLMLLSAGSGFLLHAVAFILAAVLAVYVFNALIGVARLMVYRRQVGHGAVSIPWLLGYVLTQFVLFRPLVVTAHLWGYSSSLRRRRSW